MLRYYDTVNAREELEYILKEHNKTLKCAEIEVSGHLVGMSMHSIFPLANLKVGHTEDELATFMEALNINYDPGYGGQEVYGVLWFTDGTYATRGEYDGSEWWEVHQVPEIPEELL